MSVPQLSVKNALGYVRFLTWALGLPLAGWWIAGRFVLNPPIVAPILVTSPIYAMWIVFGSFAIRHAKDIQSHQKPLEDKEIDRLTEKYKAKLGRFSGRFATISETHLCSQSLVLGGWFVINEDLWRRLNNSGREFLLIRQNVGSGNNWVRTLVSAFWFLAAFTFASINLWFILPIHILGAAAMAYRTQSAKEREQCRDREALAITRDYKGAWNYVQQVKEPREHIGERLEALKRNALELGIAV